MTGVIAATKSAMPIQHAWTQGEAFLPAGTSSDATASSNFWMVWGSFRSSAWIASRLALGEVGAFRIVHQFRNRSVRIVEDLGGTLFCLHPGFILIRFEIQEDTGHY